MLSEHNKDMVADEEKSIKDQVKKQIKLMFIVRICLWCVAFISTLYWMNYSDKLYRMEIYDPHEYATLLRPVLYTCLIISVVAVCISFALHAWTRKLKKQHGIR